MCCIESLELLFVNSCPCLKSFCIVTWFCKDWCQEGECSRSNRFGYTAMGKLRLSYFVLTVTKGPAQSEQPNISAHFKQQEKKLFQCLTLCVI